MPSPIKTRRITYWGCQSHPQANTFTRLDVGAEQVDIFYLDQDVYVAECARSGFGRIGSCSVGMRVGDKEANYCIKRFGGVHEPNTIYNNDAVVAGDARNEYNVWKRLKNNWAMPVYMLPAIDAHWRMIMPLARCNSVQLPTGKWTWLREQNKGQERPHNVAVLLLEIGRDLAELHAHNILHGDVKGTNVLVIEREGKRHLSLVDFDQATDISDPKVFAFSDKPPPDEILQLPEPEEETDQQRICRLQKKDIYALGFWALNAISLVYISDERSPPSNDLKDLRRAFETFRKGHKGERPAGVCESMFEHMWRVFEEYRRFIPSPLKELVMSMIALDPAERPTSAEVVDVVTASGLAANPERSFWLSENYVCESIEEQQANLQQIVAQLQRDNPAILAPVLCSPVELQANIVAAQKLLALPQQAPLASVAAGSDRPSYSCNLKKKWAWVWDGLAVYYRASKRWWPGRSPELHLDIWDSHKPPGEARELGSSSARLGLGWLGCVLSRVQALVAGSVAGAAFGYLGFAQAAGGGAGIGLLVGAVTGGILGLLAGMMFTWLRRSMWPAT